MRQPRRRVSVPEYNRMLDVGALTAEDRVELIDGEILAVSPMGEGYSRIEDLKASASVSPLAFPKHPFRVDDLIPSR